MVVVKGLTSLKVKNQQSKYPRLVKKAQGKLQKLTVAFQSALAAVVMPDNCRTVDLGLLFNEGVNKSNNCRPATLILVWVIRRACVNLHLKKHILNTDSQHEC